MKISPVGDELVYAEGVRDITEQKVVFSIFLGIGLKSTIWLEVLVACSTWNQIAQSTVVIS